MYAYHSITHTPRSMKAGALEIWPNPARDRIRVRIPEEGKQELRLYDLNGRIALTQTIYVPGEMPLPPGLPDGIYILEVLTGEGVYRGRLLKQ